MMGVYLLLIAGCKKDEKKDNSNPANLSLVNIPAGTFIMGSPSSEVDRGTDETQHQVTLSAFKMSKHQITFEHYDLFCEATIKHIGLLRSLAVIDEFKNQKIGQKLIKHLFDYCTIEQIDQLSNPG